MVIRKIHYSRLHEVRVGWRCYEYEGQQFPTLYAVVQAIAGSVACQHAPDDDGNRPSGVKHTAVHSPTVFFHRAFRQLVHKLPPKRKRKKKKKAG